MSALGVLTGVLLEALVLAVRRVLDELTPGEDALALIRDARARGLAEHLCQRYGAKLRVKDELPMRVAAAAFDVLGLFTSGLPDGEAFLSRYSTTIGAEIFVPRALLEAGGAALMEVLTHEAEHVAQFRGEGVAMCWWYATWAEARARYEANAYGAGATVRVYLEGTAPEVDALLPDLTAAYHVRPEDQVLARDMMRSLRASILAGSHTTEAGREAVAWLVGHP